MDADESAIDDDQNDEMGEEDTSLSMSRMRRASEGQQLIKGDGKKVNANDLKCEKCGKGYKHSSCLTKHLLVTSFLFARIFLLVCRHLYEVAYFWIGSKA